MTDTSLSKVQALTFDVFGTVVDWHGSVVRALKARALQTGSSELKGVSDEDWSEFAKEWRMGYYLTTRRIARGGEGTMNVDEMHRQILEGMLSSERWAHIGEAWNTDVRDEINTMWHFLDGWPDSSNGLRELKKNYIVSTLTNGNVRLMVDMESHHEHNTLLSLAHRDLVQAKHADLPWDLILSAELLGNYKYNPKVYQDAIRLLSVKPEQCALVAAHINDLRAAAQQGMRTIYIRRSTEDLEFRDSVRQKSEGGEVDIVVDSLEELAQRLRGGSGQ